MNEHVFSPRQVARAIGASKSSVKRWCDRGVLPFVKTAGGHRRLPIAGVLQFVRAENVPLQRPEELGLPADSVGPRATLANASTEFREALLRGDAAVCRRIMVDLYLGDRTLGYVFDEVVAPAMYAVGEAWGCGDAEVYEERRACEVLDLVLHELRTLLPAPAANAPLAMGGTPTSDPYQLPTRLVELTLLGSRWRATPLGCGIPLPSLQLAIEQHRPRLFWLSVSTVGDSEAFLDEFAALSETCGQTTALVVGGQALDESLRKRMKYAAFCDQLQHLEAYVQSLAPTQQEV